MCYYCLMTPAVAGGCQEQTVEQGGTRGGTCVRELTHTRTRAPHPPPIPVRVWSAGAARSRAPKHVHLFADRSGRQDADAGHRRATTLTLKIILASPQSTCSDRLPSGARTKPWSSRRTHITVRYPVRQTERTRPEGAFVFPQGRFWEQHAAF